jgi:hypothetical protein
VQNFTTIFKICISSKHISFHYSLTLPLFIELSVPSQESEHVVIYIHVCVKGVDFASLSFCSDWVVFEGTIRNKDGEQVILHRRRESEGRFHLFKSSWNNLKHEPFTLGLSMQNDSKLKKIPPNRNRKKERQNRHP